MLPCDHPSNVQHLEFESNTSDVELPVRYFVILFFFSQVYLIARRETEENGKKNGKCLSSNYNRKVKGVNVWFYNISLFSKR